MKNRAFNVMATILALIHYAIAWQPVPSRIARRAERCTTSNNLARAHRRCKSSILDHTRARPVPLESPSSLRFSHPNGSEFSFPDSVRMNPAHRFVARVLLPTVVAAIFWWGSVSVASAGLLDEFGSDPSKILDTSSSTRSSASTSTTAKGEKAIDPTLRASYYYPTAKKRYLPRIQKVTQEIAGLTDALAAGDWLTPVQHLAATADNAILPLQLYVSSLDGQGLSMKNQYAVQMKRDAAEFEKSYHELERAIRQQDRESALDAIAGMGVAIADYRQQGRLSDDDGYIPSIDEMKRMTMRNPTVKVILPSK